MSMMMTNRHRGQGRGGLLLLLLLLLHLHLHLQVLALEHIKTPPSPSHRLILQDSIVQHVNNANHTLTGTAAWSWTASSNPYFANHTVAQFKHMLGAKRPPPTALHQFPLLTHQNNNISLPKHFDARAAWPQCTTISTILDQGHCGSCWAFGAVESLSDRFCIHFGMNISLSVNDLLACCGFMCGDGCDGGYPIYAWRYFVQNGVVTEECDPYFDQTGCVHPGCEPEYPTPKCEKKCQVKNLLWADTKHFSVNAYRINPDPLDIMAEVYKNGPVEVAFTVYEDFAHYKSGVYKHVTGDVMGGHAVKLIGWGTSEKGEDYWLLANQWNRGWGDDGYFKILRGSNECGIEADVVAGLPSTKNLVKTYAGADSAVSF